MGVGSMRWIKNKFINITIRSKIIWSYFLVALTPLIIFAGIGSYLVVRQAGRNVFMHTDQMLKQVETAIDVYISTIEKTSNYIAKEVEDSSFFDITAEEGEIWKREQSQISKMLYNIADTHKEIAGILIATEKDLYVSTGMTRISRDSFSMEKWYRQAAENPKEIQMISNIAGRNIITNESYSIDDAFSLSKAIINPRDGRVMGVILIDIKHDIISTSIKSITLGGKGFVFVMDDSRHVVYTPVNKITYRVNMDLLSGRDSMPITTRIGGEKYQIRQEYSDYTGWKIIGVFSMDEIMGSVNAMLLILITCVGITLLCITGISFKISQTITNPITQLKKLMKRAEEGDLSVRFEVRYRDEVSVLGNNFNQMLDRIEYLIRMVYIEQQNKRNAELKVLQEQIKPHFLYNTLDTINWMAREHEAGDIVKVVDALTSMYRIGLSGGKDYITLGEEIRYVSNYLYIQKIRYGSKINYEIVEDPKLKSCEIPKLILQPLVENAIYHGIKTKRTQGHLTISTRELDNGLMELSVEDDGSGMEPEKVKELIRMLKEPFPESGSHHSFGIFYIKERLRLRYGEAFEVRIDSTRDIGTRITMVLPQAGKAPAEGAAYE
jgi:two-component system sensor histidine kinase YesM